MPNQFSKIKNLNKSTHLLVSILLTISVFTITLKAQTTFKKLTEGPVVNTLSDSRSVNFADFNQDGLEDLLITQGNSAGASDLIYLNKGDLTFELKPDWTNQISDPSVGATIADMNNDGRSDIYVTSWYNKKNVLYKGTENSGFEISQLNLNSYSESATWGDYDNDGYVDLYVCNSGNNVSDNFNFLFKNSAGTLNLQSNHVMVKESNFSRSATWIDYDNDGDIDLFICNENQTKNDLFRNDGNGNFIKITSAGDLLTEASGSMSASWADVNNDGWTDVFICNSGFFTGQPNRLYINNGDGSFTKRAGNYESDNGCSFSSSFADYDNDGDVDLVVTNGFCNGVIRNFLYLNDGYGFFSKDVTSTGSLQTPCSFGVAWGDLNDDGFQDLVIANCKNNAQAPMAKNDIWINESNNNHWIKLKLHGFESNASGIGAKIYVSALINGVRIKQKREVTSVSGYCSQNSSVVHFGMNNCEIIDTLSVIWPSGIHQTFTNIKTDETIHIHESAINSNSDQKENISFDISPNPASSSIKISAHFNKAIDTLHLQIIASDGKIVYDTSYTNVVEKWIKTIELRDLMLTQGTYYIKASTDVWSITKNLVILP